MLQTHEPVSLRSSFLFWCVSTAVSTVHTNIISMCFWFDPLSKAFFSNYLFPANSVKIKLKLESVRSEMTPVLMHFRWKRAADYCGWKAWTHRKVRVFKRNRISVDGACISVLICLHGVLSKKFTLLNVGYLAVCRRLACKAGCFVYRARRNEQTGCRVLLFPPCHKDSPPPPPIPSTSKLPATRLSNLYKLNVYHLAVAFYSVFFLLFQGFLGLGCWCLPENHTVVAISLVGSHNGKEGRTLLG